MKEFTERKKRIYQDSLNTNLTDATFQTGLTKMYKPLLDSNKTIKESLQGLADKFSDKLSDKLGEWMLSIPTLHPLLLLQVINGNL